MDVSNSKIGKRSAAVALSQSGGIYTGASFDSPTRLTSHSAEAVALLRATQQCDYGVAEVMAVYENHNQPGVISPQNLKWLIDFSYRTGQQIGYSVTDVSGETIFDTLDVRNAAPYYRPRLSVPLYIREASLADISPNCAKYNSESVPAKLGSLARLGIERAFVLSDRDQRYGAAAVTNSGTAYWSGQYSGVWVGTIHAEMAAVLAAWMDGETIYRLGVVSTRSQNRPAEVCGCCRQFLADMPIVVGDLEVICFAAADGSFQTHTLPDLLPHEWSNQLSG